MTRRGASRRSDITDELLDDLQSGHVETATLSEGLAIDLAILMERTFPDIPNEGAAQLRSAAGQGITKRMALAGSIVLDALGADDLERALEHPSDTVRGWSAFAIGAIPGITIEERIDRVRPLADDPHFGVREWAWFPLRLHLAESLDEGIAHLVPWTTEASANLRRFAVESTRPRGVWAAHLTPLKESPGRALDLLEPVRSDSDRYVQNACANWLNDAAKTQPGWVIELTDRWLSESRTEATRYIVKRARRSLSKGRTN